VGSLGKRHMPKTSFRRHPAGITQAGESRLAASDLVTGIYYQVRHQGMEKVIKDRFNKTILTEALPRYGIEADQVRLLDGFESFIYEFERG
jgi:hypothetical protein